MAAVTEKARKLDEEDEEDIIALFVLLHNEMSIDEYPVTLPGVRVTQLDSDGCDALEQLLDGLYVA